MTLLTPIGTNDRILIIDDSPAIHEDFRKILADHDPLRASEAQLFGKAEAVCFQLGFAQQGEEGVNLAHRALLEGRPYAMAFVDVRMPPGADGIETTRRIWEVDPDVQIVICTAYSDYSWDDMSDILGRSERLLILKKPFDTIEVVQMAHALTAKWRLLQESKRTVAELELRVEDRTRLLSRANESLAREMSLRAVAEIELRQAHKLEAIGQLASGIAHEINTPVQFVSDSLTFIDRAVSALLGPLNNYRRLTQSVADGLPSQVCAEEAIRAAEEADLPYLIENIPLALARSREGVERIAIIVRSMKTFAHPDSKERRAIDLNDAINSTLIIARNEYKYVAELATTFGDLPTVSCYPGELNQAILNIVVNGAHAIGDVFAVTGVKGCLSVVTSRDDEHVIIAVSDTGGGIPEGVRDRIFEPFFTTKPVGKGTGQGLAIARSAVVNRHHGKLTFETTTGVGTTFFIRLPLGEGPESVNEKVTCDHVGH